MQGDLFAAKATAASGVVSLPERVRVISLWRPYAGLVTGKPGTENAGPKTVETRTWGWPYEPGWLAIFFAIRVDKQALARIGRLAEEHLGEPQTIGGVVWVAGSRPLLRGDEPKSFFYEDGRFAWELTRQLAFKRPVPLAETGLSKGPQKFASVRREVILAALGAT